MTREELLQKIQNILTEEFEIEKGTVVPEAKLYEDLELDSIDAIDLLVKMKALIPGKIDPESFKKAVTIQDVVDILYPLIQQT
ncbi:MAG: phosphopantetheine-binding protein [Spirochaetaceae bacterium]|jgi:acyl carrier protein|nr:phosphopantetheine-binding protein [Spirochaetaceae bacterium]